VYVITDQFNYYLTLIRYFKLHFLMSSIHQFIYLSQFSHFMSTAFDSHKQIDVIKTDFSKTSDKISHNILLNKVTVFTIDQFLYVITTR